MFQLYEHQSRAINTIVESNFANGVVHYATGTGKSIIGFETVNKFNELYPTKNIIWICEHKCILQQQFNQNQMITKNLHIINLSSKKQTNWIAINVVFYLIGDVCTTMEDAQAIHITPIS